MAIVDELHRVDKDLGDFRNIYLQCVRDSAMHLNDVLRDVVMTVRRAGGQVVQAKFGGAVNRGSDLLIRIHIRDHDGEYSRMDNYCSLDEIESADVEA